MSANLQGQPVTVIIPAHNEEQALPPTLGSLMAQDFAGQLRIVVVPNGCSDRTAQVARSFIPTAQKHGFELIVVELSEGCKPKARNQGDIHAIPNSIRIYLDADIRLSRNAISAVANELREGSGIHCSRPAIQVAPAKSLVTRAYLKVWLNTPYIKNDVICGFYGVSAEGRRRWDKFPIIIADDKFTRMQFARHERKVAQDATMTIQYAEGLKELCKVRTRWTRGNIELAMVYPQLWQRDQGRYTRTVPHLLGKPTVWPCIPFFAVVYAWGWWVAYKTRKANLSTWERSNGSRARLATT